MKNDEIRYGFDYNNNTEPLVSQLDSVDTDYFSDATSSNLENLQPGCSSASSSPIFGDKLIRRAHLNAMERKRRNKIKESFLNLRESVPAIKGETKITRAFILNKAAEYIHFLRRTNRANLKAVELLKAQNQKLEDELRTLKETKQAVIDMKKAIKDEEEERFLIPIDDDDVTFDNYECVVFDNLAFEDHLRNHSV